MCNEQTPCMSPCWLEGNTSNARIMTLAMQTVFLEKSPGWVRWDHTFPCERVRACYKEYWLIKSYKWYCWWVKGWLNTYPLNQCRWIFHFLIKFIVETRDVQILSSASCHNNRHLLFRSPVHYPVSRQRLSVIRKHYLPVSLCSGTSI